jgi:hypothetical protein
MNKEALALVLEMMDLLGTGYRPEYSTLEAELGLYDIVEKLMVHDCDALIRGMLTALANWPHLGGDLKVNLQRYR